VLRADAEEDAGLNILKQRQELKRRRRPRRAKLAVDVFCLVGRVYSEIPADGFAVEEPECGKRWKNRILP
jgi:hypothetical protein